MKEKKVGKTVRTKAKVEVKAKVKTRAKTTSVIKPEVVKAKRKPIRRKVDLPTLVPCTACGGVLTSMPFDSKKRKPRYAMACNNQKCNQYRFVVSWQDKE